MPLIIDSHLDLAWNALSWKRDITLPLAELNQRDAQRNDSIARGRATTSLPELRYAGVAICLGTLMARVPYGQKSALWADSLDYPSHDAAFGAAQGQLAYYRQLERRDEVALIRTASELNSHWDRWASSDIDGVQDLPVGIILAMEGCDAIVDPSEVQAWYDQGLRCPSLVHYGRSAYAAGTGEEGPLTPGGREMLVEFSRVGMILDVTHLSDASFFEALEIFAGPVIASHQNCRTLVPGQRQFSDEQIRCLLERGGILGAACDAWMLHEGWVRGDSLESMTPRNVVAIDALADHVDHICQLAGNSDQVAIGSDLDGGFGTEQTPAGLDTIADLQKLAHIFADRGYSDAQIDAVFHGNWLRFFRQHLPA